MSLPPPGPPSDGQPPPTGGFAPPPGGGFGPPAGAGFGPPGYQPGSGPPVVQPGGFHPPGQTPIPVTPSDQKPPSGKGKFIIAAVIVAALAGGGIAFAATRGGDDDSDSSDRDDRITLPDEITLPDFSLPEFTLPDDITIPDEITLPDEITIPDEITLPDDITIPDEITLPDDVTIPDDVTLPTFPSDVTIPAGPATPLGTPADLGEGFTVQVNSFNPDDTAALTATPATPTPADGNVYATVNVTITYDGSPGLGYIVALDFTALRPPDVSANWYNTLFVTAPDGLPLTAELQPGESATGTIVFEVPAASTGELTLVASTLLSFDGSAVAFALH